MEFSENQKKAIEFYEGCCNVIASAGSGKTSVLVNRICNLVMEHDVDPNKILAITFSKKAKENMMERLERLLPEQCRYLHIETFHSFGYSLIRKFNRISYQILDADWKKIKIIEGIYKKLHEVVEVDKSVLADCLRQISMQKNHLQFPNPKPNNLDERIYLEYEKHKRDNLCLDFDDMLTVAYEILRDNEKALKHCQKQYQFILADEMQDTNTAQYEMLRLIAQKHQNLYIVSDPVQNIFEWRGSDNKYVLNFDDDWDNVETINLNCNYRSSADIVSLANKFAQTVPESKHKHYVESIADRPPYKAPEYSCYLNETEEAKKIASKIRSMVQSESHQYGDFAILARTNAQLVNFESFMHKLAVPYTIVDSLPFVERKEIKIVLSYLKLACDLSDDDSFIYIYNKPNRYLGNQFLEEAKRTAAREKASLFCSMDIVASRNKKYATGVKELSEVVNHLRRMKYSSVKECVDFIRRRLKLDSYVSDEMSDDNNACDKTDNLDVLASMAKEYKSIEEFVLYLSKLSPTNAESDNAVKLMTIHKSKGLEYPVVFVIGVNDKFMPHHRNQNINEERRLMYVAITRAERELYISSTETYGDKEMNPSVFIEEIF